MKKNIKILLALIWAIFIMAQNDQTASAQHKLLGMSPFNMDSSPHNNDQRAAWFPQAGLGLFIHWGAISGYGGGDISWCMLANKSWNNDGTVVPSFYYSLMDTWNPQKWDPDALIRQAKEAGFQYTVLTTKHHDGYTLWPSNYGDLGTKTKMKHRDLLKPYVDACRKYGLKIGFYYSPPDWWFDRHYRNWSYNDSVILDMNHKKLEQLPQKPKDHDIKRKEMVANQVRELLSLYGKIDLLWFDGGQGEISNEEVRQLQPGIVINRRNGEKGDYGDSEGVLPEKRFQGWFETCKPEWPMRWWSHVPIAPYESAATVLTDFIKLRAWGGNLLANIAPLGDGTIPNQATLAMKQMSVWMKHSGESVRNVQAGNYPEKSTIPITVKDNVIYAFALPAYLGEMKITVTKKPQKIFMLRTKRAIPFSFVQNQLTIYIPPQERTLMPDVIKVIF